MSNPNDVLVDIKGRIDGPGGLKQASAAAQAELKDLNQEAQKGGAIAAESARGQELMSVALGAVGLSAAAAGTAVVAYGALLVAQAKAYLSTANTLGTLAERYDMTVEQMSLMRLEATVGNTTVEKLASGYQALSVKMLAANSGNKEAAAIFKALGVEYEDGTGKLRAVDAVMNDLHDRFGDMERGPGRAAVAAKLFGKGLADDLLPWLTQSSSELQKLRSEAEKLGLKISSETAAQVKQFDDNVNVLKLSAEGLGKSLAVNVVDSLVNVTERMREARKEGGLLKTVLEGLRQGTAEAAGVGSEKQQLGTALSERDRLLKDVTRMQGKQDVGKPSPILADSIAMRWKSINDQQREIERLQQIIGIRDPTGYSEVPRGSGKTAAPDSITKDTKEKAARGLHDTGESLVIQLQNQLDALNHEATMYEKVQRQISEGTKQYSEVNKEKALSLAAAMDAQKGLNDEAARTLHLAKLQDAAEAAGAKAAEDHRLSLDRQAQAIRESLDPWEVYKTAITKLNELLREGVLSQDEYAQAAVKAGDTAQAAVKKMAEHGTEGFDDLKNAIEGWGRSASRTFASAAVDGTLSFKTIGNAAKNLLSELLAIQVQKRLMDPLLKAGTSWIDSLVGGGKYPVDPGFQGIGASPYHSGRGPGEFSAPRYVHPAYFENAPRFHSGVGPGEMPAIIRKDESVLTPGQMRAMGGAPKVTINLINQSGQPVEAKASQPRIDGGEMVVDLLLTRLSRDAGAREGLRTVLGAPQH